MRGGRAQMTVPSGVASRGGPGSEPPRRRGSQRSWVGITANAHSGAGPGPGSRRSAGRGAPRRGWRCGSAGRPDERRAMVEQAPRRRACRCLVAAGGDGTVAALVNERPPCRSPCSRPAPRTCSPGISALPRPERLAATIASGRRIAAIDLGLTAAVDSP